MTAGTEGPDSEPIDADTRPWLRLYRDLPTSSAPEFTDALAMFRATATRAPQGIAIRYFDCNFTFADLDEYSDAFAVGLVDEGFEPGNRLAVYLQNMPQFVIAMIGTWKAGGIMVSVNPMSRERELRTLLTDSGAAAIVCTDELYEEVAKEVCTDLGLALTIVTGERDMQTRDDPRIFGPAQTRASNLVTLASFCEPRRGRKPTAREFNADDVALLTYTSGTTGPAKGAMNTHGNFAASSQNFRDWCGLTAEDSILGIAPLFHITGLVGHIGLSMLAGIPLVLTHRFDPGVVLEAIREHQPSFTVAAITAFISISNAPGVADDDLSSLRVVYSGGAPVSPAVADRFRDRFGIRINSVYGLTETTSPTHMVPLGASAPVDPQSGALSVGVPIANTMAWIIGDDGQSLPAGGVGEIVISGPQVVPGYWNKPEETANALPGGALHTGDIGVMDADGWFYIVDRKKDQINASGYKVWPREVEDVLYEHPAVREAAVVGVPDAYRGETVKAFVSLQPEAAVTADELVEFCRVRMAAYKYPRVVEFLEDLPKTTSGKTLRRNLA